MLALADILSSLWGRPPGGTCKIPQTACLRGALWARLIIPPLKQQPLLSRDREGVVLFARFIGILQVPLPGLRRLVPLLVI
jgi:hypothetical protein